MKTFLIRYGNDLIEVSKLKDVSVVRQDNGITDYFNGIDSSWYLVAFEKDGRFHLIAYTDNHDILEQYRHRILSAYANGKSEVCLEKI